MAALQKLLGNRMRSSTLRFVNFVVGCPLFQGYASGPGVSNNQVPQFNVCGSRLKLPPAAAKQIKLRGVKTGVSFRSVVALRKLNDTVSEKDGWQ